MVFSWSREYWIGVVREVSLSYSFLSCTDNMHNVCDEKLLLARRWGVWRHWGDTLGA